MIGRLEPQKDTALGLRAMAALRRIRPAARLELVGEGPDRAVLQMLAAELGVPVRFAGRVQDVTSVLDGAAALLVTSRYEGGPAVAIEALARGVPVVSTDCSALLRDVLTAPEAGTIVPSRDPEALAAALVAQTLRPDPSRLAVLGRFRPEVSAARYRALLLGI
jgi:glycosyltransferase involved in cell wall biosynthesis